MNELLNSWGPENVLLASFCISFFWRFTNHFFKFNGMLCCVRATIVVNCKSKMNCVVVRAGAAAKNGGAFEVTFRDLRNSGVYKRYYSAELALGAAS